jgi:uncharacterized protein YndB with AHSA1/START domain
VLALTVERRLAATPSAVWTALVDTRCWSQWGPSLSAATVDGGGTVIGAGATGRVKTVVGVWLPFQITEWEEGRRWAWKVGGVPATAHEVRADPHRTPGSLATIEVPWWAGAYGALCWVALGRLGEAALDRGVADPG